MTTVGARFVTATFAAIFFCLPVDAQVLRIGAKNFTEQQILGELVAQLLERHAGAEVERRFTLGGTGICHEALVSGEIDGYVEYTGTALTAVLKEDVGGTPDAVFRSVARRYRNEFDVVWLPPFGFETSYVLAVRRAAAVEKTWRSIGDLSAESKGLRGGFTSEFLERPDGLSALNKAYGLTWKRTIDLDPGLMYDALLRNEVDVIGAFSTDGRIDRFNLAMLEDTARTFPPYFAAPIFRADAMMKCPEIVAALYPLTGAISASTMRRLNDEVEGNRRPVSDVVSEFLDDRDGIETSATPQFSPSGSVGLERLFDLFVKRRSEIGAKILDHAFLAIVATLIACLIGIPLGVLVARRGIAEPILALAETAQTIPSLAMLAFLFAVVRRLGVVPAVTALVVYGMLPILLNTVVGLRRVPASVREAAESLGLTSFQKVAWVDLPSARPTILAGVRTAIVLAVGTATLSTYVGAGGLGDFIARGLARNDPQLTLLGAIPAAVMAVGFSWILRRLASPRH